GDGNDRQRRHEHGVDPGHRRLDKRWEGHRRPPVRRREGSSADPAAVRAVRARCPVTGVPKLDLLLQRAGGPITARVTKFGGQPVWLEEPAWPLTPATGEPMEFVAQV